MGTPAGHVRTSEVKHEEVQVGAASTVEKLNRTAGSLQLTERLAYDATVADVAAFKARIKAAVESL